MNLGGWRLIYIRIPLAGDFNPDINWPEAIITDRSFKGRNGWLVVTDPKGISATRAGLSLSAQLEEVDELIMSLEVLGKNLCKYAK